MATSDSPSRFNLIDLFAGVGGLTSGFRDKTMQGSCIFTPRLLVDIDPEARPVAMQNFPETPYLVRDVHSLSGAEIRLRAGLERKDTLHTLVGGPPCQGFSSAGRRRANTGGTR